MSSKDAKIKAEINEILQNDFAGVQLKNYFEKIPDKDSGRAIHILSTIYPDKIIIPDDDFLFISYMLSHQIYLKQERFLNLFAL
jgi:hypothetical protein